MYKLTKMPRINLRKLILSLTLFFVFLTFIIVQYANYHEQKKLLIENALEANRVYAEKLADFTDKTIGSIQKKLAYKSQYIALHLNETSVLDDYVNDLLNASNGFNSVQIINEQGIVVASSPNTSLREGTHLSSTVSKEILEKQVPMISSPFSGTRKENIITISHPIFDLQKRYKGYVQGTIFLQEQNIIQSTLGEHYYKDGSYIYVIDHTRHLLFHPEVNRLGTIVKENSLINNLLNNQRGALIVKDSLGKEMLAGYATVPSLRWGIVVQRPVDIAFLKLNEFIISSLLKALPLIFILIIIILYLSKKIALPLWKLALQAREMDAPDAKQNLTHIQAWYFEAAQLKESMLYGLKQMGTKMDQLDRESLTDPLTGLTNRRGIERKLSEWGSISYAILSFDIDHFKHVNDTYGHDVGDTVLQMIATQMRLNFRPNDLLCRVGGEEFLILMPSTTIDEAYVAAERLRYEIEQHPFDHIDHITISIGVSHSERASDFISLVKQADMALYKAKNSGRNCTILAGN